MKDKGADKKEIHNLITEIFNMISDLNISDGVYLEFANMFKKLNLDLDKFIKAKETINNSFYYNMYMRTPRERKKITDEEKRKCSSYLLCNCGRYVHKAQLNEHIKKTGVHYQGLRNIKFAAKKSSVLIDFEINRETTLDAFCLNHQKKVYNNGGN